MRNSRITSFKVDIFTTPLKRPFITSLGRKTATTNVGITVTLSRGVSGYGEASASLVLAHLSPAKIASALKRLGGAALGREISNPRKIAEDAWSQWGAISPAASAFECALWQAALAERGMTISQWTGGKLLKIESDITLSAWDPHRTAAAAREAAREGFNIFKIKVGGNLAVDMQRIREVARICPRGQFLLDGNQGLNLKSSMRLIEQCFSERIPVTLLEQPLPKEQWREMKALTRICPIPVAADEMVFTPQDAIRIASEQTAAVINIKVAKSGILRSLEIAAIARSAGLKLMIGCMAETARGLASSVHLALGTGCFTYVDLDSDHLLNGDQSNFGWKRRGPQLSLN